MDETSQGTRENEWWVPKWGSPRLRLFLGLTFYPYSLMNASYTLIGSLLAPSFSLYRAGLLAVVYLLAVGISAHAFDAIAPNRPWGEFLTRNQLLVLAYSALIPSLLLGFYLAASYAPLLLLIGGLEIFFLFSYNLEPFNGFFHTDFWFSLSWGFLPVVAGYVLQANSFSLVTAAAGGFGFLTAYIEINASRPYKEIKMQAGSNSAYSKRFESILKGIVAAVLLVAILLLIFRTA